MSFYLKKHSHFSWVEMDIIHILYIKSFNRSFLRKLSNKLLKILVKNISKIYKAFLEF